MKRNTHHTAALPYNSKPKNTKTQRPRKIRRTRNIQGQLGATLVEYAVLIAFIAAIGAAALTELGQSMANVLCKAASGTSTNEDAFKLGARYNFEKGCCTANLQDGTLGNGNCL